MWIPVLENWLGFHHQPHKTDATPIFDRSPGLSHDLLCTWCVPLWFIKLSVFLTEDFSIKLSQLYLEMPEIEAGTSCMQNTCALPLSYANPHNFAWSPSLFLLLSGGKSLLNLCLWSWFRPSVQDSWWAWSQTRRRVALLWFHIIQVVSITD